MRLKKLHLLAALGLFVTQLGWTHPQTIDAVELFKVVVWEMKESKRGRTNPHQAQMDLAYFQGLKQRCQDGIQEKGACSLIVSRAQEALKIGATTLAGAVVGAAVGVGIAIQVHNYYYPDNAGYPMAMAIFDDFLAQGAHILTFAGASAGFIYSMPENSLRLMKTDKSFTRVDFDAEFGSIYRPLFRYNEAAFQKFSRFVHWMTENTRLVATKNHSGLLVFIDQK